MLASYVVFQNHLPMVADYPSAYRGHPALPILAAIPTTWDDTRCLAGEVGEFIVIARGRVRMVGRRDGRPRTRDVAVPLDFLGPGRFKAEIDRDDLDAAPIRPRDRRGLGQGRLAHRASPPRGGLLIRLTPASGGREDAGSR